MDVCLWCTCATASGRVRMRCTRILRRCLRARAYVCSCCGADAGVRVQARKCCFTMRMHDVRVRACSKLPVCAILCPNAYLTANLRSHKLSRI
eukprot:4230916-Pleurochrysis_carterae.AAC.1